jgi:hypothetical protein
MDKLEWKYTVRRVVKAAGIVRTGLQRCYGRNTQEIREGEESGEP